MTSLAMIFGLVCAAVLQALSPSWTPMGQAKVPFLLGLALYYALYHDRRLMRVHHIIMYERRTLRDERDPLVPREIACLEVGIVWDLEDGRERRKLPTEIDGARRTLQKPFGYAVRHQKDRSAPVYICQLSPPAANSAINAFTGWRGPLSIIHVV